MPSWWMYDNRVLEKAAEWAGHEAGGEPPDVLIAAFVRELEREAKERVVRSLVGGLHQEERYHLDATFHVAVDTIALIAVQAVFGYSAPTPEECDQRVRMLNRFIGSVMLPGDPAQDLSDLIPGGPHVAHATDDQVR